MHNSPQSYRQLQPEDRVTLASLKQQNYSVREIGRVLGRPASTISRELHRNTFGGQYGSATAQRACLQRRAQARPVRKLHNDTLLFGVVQHLLYQRWSPEQIALTMTRIYPKGHKYRVSHETIYNCIYAQPVGELRKELIACLRHAHNKRVPRSKGQDRRGQIAKLDQLGEIYRDEKDGKTARLVRDAIRLINTSDDPPPTGDVRQYLG